MPNVCRPTITPRNHRTNVIRILGFIITIALALTLLGCGIPEAPRPETVTIQLEDGFSATLDIRERDAATKTLSAYVTIHPPSAVEIVSKSKRYDSIRGYLYIVTYRGATGSKTQQLPITQLVRGFKVKELGDTAWEAPTHPAALSPG